MLIEYLGVFLPSVTALLGVLIAYYFARASFEASKEFDKKIDEAESRAESKPEKSRYAWDLARLTLDKYFKTNLRQVSAIFWWSVFVMLLGVGIIGWGITQAINSPDSTLPSVITGLAGVITEFIGATFLFIYRSTLLQAENYTKMLERINTIGMAMQILDTIPKGAKDDDLKNSTKAIVVKMFMQQAYKIDVLDNNTPESNQS